MITGLYLAGNYINYTGQFGHLQLVGAEGINLWEIEVQSNLSTWIALGIDSNQDHTLSANYNVPGNYGIIPISFIDGNQQSRTPDDVWQLFKQAGASFTSANIPMQY